MVRGLRSIGGHAPLGGAPIGCPVRGVLGRSPLSIAHNRQPGVSGRLRVPVGSGPRRQRGHGAGRHQGSHHRGDRAGRVGGTKALIIEVILKVTELNGTKALIIEVTDPNAAAPDMAGYRAPQRLRPAPDSAVSMRRLCILTRAAYAALLAPSIRRSPAWTPRGRARQRCVERGARGARVARDKRPVGPAATCPSRPPLAAVRRAAVSPRDIQPRPA